MSATGTAYTGVPGLVEATGDRGETTLVIDPARAIEACLYLRDSERFNMLVDVTAADYLGWGREGVAGYLGTADGRDLNGRPGTWTGSQGFQRVPDPKPARFSVSWHLLRIADDPARVRVQVWLNEGEELASVIGIWPSADWYEREVFDMFGIRFSGHPNLVRILMPEDWDGHPLRKDHPIGGEPVRFSGEE